MDPNYVWQLPGAIDRAIASEQRLTTQLSSGLKLTQLSDDAVAAANNVGLASAISRTDSFVKNSTQEQSLMQVTDNALGEVVSHVTSAISLAVQASNGTLSGQSLRSIQAQVASLRDSVMALANTSYEGHYVFSGSQGGTKPFTQDSTIDPAVATYHGDAVMNTMQTPDGQAVGVNVTGDQIFQGSGGDLLGTLNKLVSDLGTAASGGSAMSSASATANLQADTAALTGALGVVSGQRAGLDSSLSRLISAATYAGTQRSVYLAQQSALLSVDPVQVATDLKAAEVQQQALLSVTATLDGQQNLFSYMK
jgi:flagellar hook-associated protein 3 FlgL